MAALSSDIATTGPIGIRRVTQLESGVGDVEGLGEGDGDALTVGKGAIFRCASSRTTRMVTASPMARATNATLASAGCNQRALRYLPGTQAGGSDEPFRPAPRSKGARCSMSS